MLHPYFQIAHLRIRLTRTGFQSFRILAMFLGLLFVERKKPWQVPLTPHGSSLHFRQQGAGLLLLRLSWLRQGPLQLTAEPLGQNSPPVPCKYSAGAVF